MPVKRKFSNRRKKRTVSKKRKRKSKLRVKLNSRKRNRQRGGSSVSALEPMASPAEDEDVEEPVASPAGDEEPVASPNKDEEPVASPAEDDESVESPAGGITNLLNVPVATIIGNLDPTALSNGGKMGVVNLNDTDIEGMDDEIQGSLVIFEKPIPGLTAQLPGTKYNVLVVPNNP